MGSGALPRHLLLAETGDLRGLAVPLVDQPVCVDAKDGRVGPFDDLLQVVGHLRLWVQIQRGVERREKRSL